MATTRKQPTKAPADHILIGGEPVYFVEPNGDMELRIPVLLADVLASSPGILESFIQRLVESERTDEDGTATLDDLIWAIPQIGRSTLFKATELLALMTIDRDELKKAGKVSDAYADQVLHERAVDLRADSTGLDELATAVRVAVTRAMPSLKDAVGNLVGEGLKKAAPLAASPAL